MYISLESFLPAIISSVVAAIAIMVSSWFVEHDLEWKHALVMAFVANIVTTAVTPAVLPIAAGYASTIVIGGLNLLSIAIDLLFWVILAMLIMKESYTSDKIKIAVYGFLATTITLFVLELVNFTQFVETLI